MLTNLWAGAPSGLDRYMDLCAKYFKASHTAAPLEASHHSVRMANLFEVDEDRIGLSLVDRQGDKASLKITGSLVSGHAWWHQYTDGEITSYDAINDAVAMLEASGVKEVLLNVESTGGMVTGLARASKSLSRLSGKTKVTAHVDNYAMSAGYWLLVAPKAKISASEMAQIGSIGIFAAYPDYSEALAKDGVKYHVFSAGTEKSYGFSGVEFTAEEKQALQKSVDTANNFFLTHVSKSRNLMMSDTDSWAEAQIFYAGEAKAVGLIDQVADLDEVLGSSPAPNPKGDNAMPISEEKLARIFAGEAPETVLTAEELTQYMATAVEEPEVTEPVVEEPVTTDPVVAEPVVTVEDAKAIGRLEAKLEFSAEALTEAKTANETLKADIQNLLVVAQEAVSNLQVALQKPKEAKSSVSGVLAQFNDLQVERAERFKVGRKSSTKVETQKAANIPNPLRPV